MALIFNFNFLKVSLPSEQGDFFGTEMLTANYTRFGNLYQSSTHIIECVGWRSHSSLILSILQFFEPNHLMFCLNLHCLFPVPHVQLILLLCRVNQKRRSSKTLKIFVSFKKIWEWFRNYLDRGTAIDHFHLCRLLTPLPWWNPKK